MSEEQIFERVIATIVEASTKAKGGIKVRIFAENKVGCVTPDEMKRALEKLSRGGMLEIQSQKDNGGTFTSFDLLLLKPFLAQIEKTAKEVPLTAPKDLSPANFSAVMDFMDEIQTVLEMTRDSEIKIPVTSTNPLTLEYLTEHGCFSSIDEQRGKYPTRHDYLISIDRPVFLEFYGLIKNVHLSRSQPKEVEAGTKSSLEGFYFDQGVLCRHGHATVETFPENSIEHVLLIVTFQTPIGERIDGSRHLIDFSWRSLYDAARRINKKVAARFGVDDFFKINHDGKFIERNI